jgi:hypothetical protein
MSSTKVFVAGSRAITRLPPEVRSRIDTMAEKQFTVLVGDANGADKAFQKYLADRAYPNVIVHFMKGRCRNNLGSWPAQEISAPRGARGFDFYAVKDVVMAEAADYGLMLWDGVSRGTLNNVVNLARRNKPVVMYIEPTKSVETIRSVEEVRSLIPSKSADDLGIFLKLPFGAAR